LGGDPNHESSFVPLSRDYGGQVDTNLHEYNSRLRVSIYQLSTLNHQLPAFKTKRELRE